MATFTIKVEVHDNTIKEMCDFLGVTQKKAREILANNISQRIIPNTSVIVMCEDSNTIVHKLCIKKQEAREIAKLYSNYRVIDITTGDRYYINNLHGSGMCKYISATDVKKEDTKQQFKDLFE